MSVDTEVIKYPWQPQSVTRANLAIGGLRNNLLSKTNIPPEGVHTPSLLTFAGALAGFAAQNAVWKHIRSAGVSVPELRRGGPPASNSDFLWVRAASGEIFYFGNLLNERLSPQEGMQPLTLWGIVAGAASAAGIPPGDLPPVDDMYAHVTRTIGTKDYGYPRVPAEIRPAITAQQAVKIFWPLFREVMIAEPPSGFHTAIMEPLLVEEHWPLIASIVASQLLANGKEVLDPKLAFTIIMESAIAASKLDPRTVPVARTPLPAVRRPLGASMAARTLRRVKSAFGLLAARDGK